MPVLVRPTDGVPWILKRLPQYLRFEGDTTRGSERVVESLKLKRIRDAA